MYDNIGGKIKGLAKIIGIGGAILFAILGFIFIFVAADAYSRDAPTYWTLCITFFVLCPVSLLVSLPLYGFGELVEKVGKIADNRGASIQAPLSGQALNGARTAVTVSNDLPEL